MDFSSLPISRSLLETYRLAARRQVRANMVGGHTTRRMGHSLEFAEYSSYNPGDEIRHIDWRASFRVAAHRPDIPWDGWRIRRFAAEEHLKVVVSLDTRETMFWPRHPAMNPSKIQVARWLAEALTFVALRSKDQVVWHRLFGDGPPPLPVRSGGTESLHRALQSIAGQSETNERFNDAGLDRFLPPSSAWIIITDFYFDPARTDDIAHLLQTIRAARNGLRWILLVELDTWPYEERIMGQGARLVMGPGSAEGKQIVVTDQILEEAKAEISRIKQSFFKVADHTRWVWPADVASPLDFGQFFESSFIEDRLLQRLFMRET